MLDAIADEPISRELLRSVIPVRMHHLIAGVDASVEEMFPRLSRDQHELCVAVGVATCIFELDKAGALQMEPRAVALMYQLGRLAAQELAPEIKPPLHRLMQNPATITEWLDGAAGRFDRETFPAHRLPAE